MSNQQMDWKDISFRFCPPSVYRDLEAILLVRRNGEKLLAETLGVPRQTIDTAGRRTQSSSKDILDYLKEDGQTTWRTFYSAVGSHHRHDIKTDVLDKPDTQKAILDYYKNSKEYTLKIPPKAPTEVDDPMHHLLTGKDHDEIGRKGRLLFLFNACSQKRACAMGRYFYDQFKIGVKLGYWSLKNEGCEEIGQEIMQDVVKSNWIAICLDKPYVQVIRDFEDSREKYRPLPRNKNFNIRYTYALLKAEYQRHGPSAHQILLFYTPDIDLRLLPEWLLNASSQTRYKLPVSSNLLLTEMDQKNLYWIFRQVGLLSDHIGQRSDQARLYKQNVYQ
ncbi:uncharacterized protein LOC135492897 isoform X2 [Lineus longissimus]|uniref:uncharacterized protein LOC135492897 isoform X2 n=1 Tax=Lineus longissimus TaxID=88925 RepID=UPI00315CEB0B